jgi:hypothetical protein
VNCREKEPVVFKPESQSPLGVQQVPEVEVCGTVSTKFHWTVSPALTVVVLVLLAESRKTLPDPALTMWVVPLVGGGVGVGCGPGGGVAAGGVTMTG